MMGYGAISLILMLALFFYLALYMYDIYYKVFLLDL